jgi:hypothetical protein
MHKGKSMPANLYISYDTESEARAFLDGVQFVNDSAIEVHGLFLIPKEAVATPDAMDIFVVHLTDADRSEDEDEGLPEGFDSQFTTRLSAD